MRDQGTNILYFLLGTNIFMFILTYLFGRYFDSSQIYTFLALGAENFDLFISGQVWRMVTSAFLHANFIHLLMNMFYLFQIGTLIERYFGGKKLLITYIVTAITGSGLSLLMAYVFNNHASVSVGASGAIFGLFGLIIASAWKGEKQYHTFGIPIDYRSLIPYIAISIILGFVIPGINNAAHIGGFLGGVLLGFIIKPEIGYASGAKDLFEDVLFYISAGAFVLSFGALILFNLQFLQ